MKNNIAPVSLSDRHPQKPPPFCVWIGRGRCIDAHMSVSVDIHTHVHRPQANLTLLSSGAIRVFETRVSRWALGLADSAGFMGQQVPRTHLPPTPQQWDSEHASLRLSFTWGPDSGP